ncbi:MAG: dTMP kinase [Nanoarchaeota archaeon]|nr:dTMP kinase [Nanoarchaeota archaeon]MBU1704751.1 dTMP kinase [Nanoarchaeota archaeon]
MKKFIVFDGLDGSGKGEMIRRLEAYLKDKGNKVLVTREPTNGRFGKKAQEILKTEKDPKASAEKCLELFTKDREEHLTEIEDYPGIVICDRYYYSTIAFQHTQGLALERVIAANIEFKTPDITFILDLPPEIALKRISKRGAAKEKFEKLEFMKELRKNFLRLKDELEDNIVIIDASKTKEEVFEQINKEIDKIITEN